MDPVQDYGGYESDLEEPPPKKPLVEPGMDSTQARSYKTNPDKLGGFTSYQDKEAWKIQVYHLKKLDAYQRHRELIMNYVKYYGGKMKDFKRDSSKDRNDFTVLQENHRFLWDTKSKVESWEERFAKKYYDRLFKEYCVGDLSRYQEKKIALRWRTEAEVKSGKGQFVCGDKRCGEKEMLVSWEVNFGYQEQGEKKNALVKIRLCPDCSIRLNLIKKVRKVSKKKKEKKRKKNRSHHESSEKEEIGESSRVGEENEEEEKTGGNNIWSGPAPETLIKSNAEQMDDFLEDMFM